MCADRERVGGYSIGDPGESLHATGAAAHSVIMCACVTQWHTVATGAVAHMNPVAHSGTQSHMKPR